MRPGQLPSSSSTAVESSWYNRGDPLPSACHFILPLNLQHTYTHIHTPLPAKVCIHTHICTHSCMRKHLETCVQWLTCQHEKPLFTHIHSQTHVITHTAVLRAIICHLGRNLQSCSLCWRLGLKAFLWKFMSKQLWSHPPLYGPWRQRCPRNYGGDPIHYTPPVTSWVCVHARVSRFLCVSLYGPQHV